MGQSAAKTPSHSCCTSSEGSAKPDQKLDTVVIDIRAGGTLYRDAYQHNNPQAATASGKRVSFKEYDSVQVAEDGLAVQRPRAFKTSSAFSCTMGLATGPEVEVSNVTALSARVSWRVPAGAPDVRRWHIEVLDGIQETAFLEAPGDCGALDLPPGILKRASGPYCIQVAAESGPAGDDATFSQLGISRTFFTPPQIPSPAVWPRLTETPSETQCCIEWDEPIDDGGSQIKEYELSLCKKIREQAVQSLDAICEEESGMAIFRRGLCRDSTMLRTTVFTSKRTHVFDGLTPGENYRIDVVAISLASMRSIPATLTARCKAELPGAPTALHAQLQPWLPNSGKWGDTIRIEFTAPQYDGGRSLECFKVRAVEHQHVESKVLHVVTFAEALGKVSEQSEPAEAPRCIIDVEVAPNSKYAFIVQASNGECLGPESQLTPTVFVPARVPSPPSKEPVVSTVQRGVAELRWQFPQVGGGHPVDSFKVGIMAGASKNIVRELTVAESHAFIKHGESEEQAMLLDDGSPGEPLVTWGATVDSLEADTRYRFVIAATNCLGTGCWSQPSSFVSTPIAAPLAPKNLVAAIALDDFRQTAINLTWLPAEAQGGTGRTVAYHLTISRRAAGLSTFLHSSTVQQTRIQAIWTGKMTSTCTVKAPGSYKVELASENTMGQRSAPAVLSLEVPAELFQTVQTSSVPQWAVPEPLLLLGQVEMKDGDDESLDMFINNDDEERCWQQAVLLWEGGDGGNSSASAAGARTASTQTGPVDVVCFYRHPTTNEPHTTTIGESVEGKSHLQLQLPSHVPMSLRLSMSDEPVKESRSRKGKKEALQSDPLLLHLDANGQYISTTWEVWMRRSSDGAPPRWVFLPDDITHSVEAAWREGQPAKTFTISVSDDCGGLSQGDYKIVFGDDRRLQHSLECRGPSGWQANARRQVVHLQEENEESSAAAAAQADDQCVICFERRRTHAFMHAEGGGGHLAICGSCAETFRAERAAGSASQAFRNCPMCRRPFSALERIY